MEEELNNIELRSEEVQEIMGHIPSKIIRYGITVIFSIVFILFVGSFFFKYPDILIAPVEVLTENPPASIIAKSSGNLSDIFVQDSQFVEQNTKLAVIKNPANYVDVLALKEILIESNFTAADSSSLIKIPESLQLGDIQNSYTSLLSLRQDYFQFLRHRHYSKKIEALKRKYVELNKYAQLMQKQASLRQRDYNLTQNQYERDSILCMKEVISKSELEKSKKNLLQNGLSLENTKSSVVNANIQQQDLKQQIIDLEIEYSRETENYTRSLTESYQNLLSRIAWWTDVYILESPARGIVAFNKIWSKNQVVKAGDEVFSVLPQQSSKIVGRITLEAKGAGKVQIGQRVNIKLDEFNHQEFGMITTQVSNISMIPSNKAYMVDVALPDTLITNYGFLLPFSQKMIGSAEIVTEDLPLIVRLFNPLKSILKRHVASPKVRKVHKENYELRTKDKEIKTKVERLAEESENIEMQTNYQNDTLVDIKTYHIIAASFIDFEKAKNYKNQYSNKGYNTQIISANNRYRLSLFNTPNKEQALKKLTEIRKAENNEAIWILLN